MSLKEALRGKPKAEISHEQLGKVVDKLLKDLEKGYIIETYQTWHLEDEEKEWDEESLKQDAELSRDGYCVVLKGKKYYKVSVTRFHTGHATDQQSLRAEEYGSIEDMTDWQNVTRTVNFTESHKFIARECNIYGSGSTVGWSQWPLEPVKTIDLLNSIMKAKVDIKATRKSFEIDTSEAKKPYLSPQIIRWPRINNPK